MNELEQEQQRLVNLLFDEVKLISTIRLSGGHTIEYATNDPNSQNILVSSALVFEIIRHYGGPSYIFQVHTTHKLNAKQLQQILMEA